MATCISTTPRAPSKAPEGLRTLVEIDHRRGSIGLHLATDPTRPARTTSTLWLPPDEAEAIARAILAAVDGWRADQAVSAWTVTTGGRAHG